MLCWTIVIYIILLISLSLSRNALPFEEPDGSLPNSQQPTTGPHPKSNYHIHNIQPFLINSYIINYPTGSPRDGKNKLTTTDKKIRKI